MWHNPGLSIAARRPLEVFGLGGLGLLSAQHSAFRKPSLDLPMADYMHPTIDRDM